MNVRLVSLTQGILMEVEPHVDKRLSPEELIVYIARVSNPSNQMNTETSDKLIKYLIKNKHWSPFSMVDMTVEIKTSRAVAQQIIRHKSFDFQEFSQRYAEVSEFEPVQIRKQAEKNRQSSAENFDPTLDINWLVEDEGGVSLENGFGAQDIIGDLVNMSEAVYKALLKAGVAKECARMILPLTTQTTIYMKGGLRSWLTYLNIRLEEHTQSEHREIAVKIAEIVKENFPNISSALNDFNDFKGGFI